MKLFLLCISISLVFKDGNCQALLSDKQLQSATKLMRNVCQPKFKITNAQIDALHRGEFSEDRSVVCYMECVLRMAKMMKGNKYDYESTVKTAKTFPLERQEPTLLTATNCKESVVHDEKCMAASDIYKCIYLDNPENFGLP